MADKIFMVDGEFPCKSEAEARQAVMELYPYASDDELPDMYDRHITETTEADIADIAKLFIEG